LVYIDRMMGYKNKWHILKTSGCSITLVFLTTMTLHGVHSKPASNEGISPLIKPENDGSSLGTSNSMYEEDQGFGLFSRRKLGGISKTSNVGIGPIMQNDMNSVASSNSMYNSEQGLGLFSRKYLAPKAYYYGNFDNNDYVNANEQYIPEKYNPPQNLNTPIDYDRLDNTNSDLSSINTLGDPSLSSNIYYPRQDDSSYFPNSQFPNQQQNSFIDYLSPKPENSIPEYDYIGSYDYGSIPEYPVRPDYPVPRPDYPVPRPEYPDYDGNNNGCNTPSVCQPCIPCQWYEQCCFNNCIQSCEEEIPITVSPWPWPTPDPTWPTPDPTWPTIPPSPPTDEPTTTTPKPKCHVPGWHFINGKEIYLSEIYRNDKTLSWYEADSKAGNIGGHLAEITSEEETDLFNQVKECYPYGVPDFWIGGSDMANFTNWVWSRGTPVDCIGCYTNWVPQVQGPKDHCMKLKFVEIESMNEGSGNNEDGNTSPEYTYTNKWYKEICKGEPRPTAFLAERIQGTLPSPTEASTRPTIPTEASTRPTIPTEASTRPTFPTIPPSPTPVQPTDEGPH